MTTCEDNADMVKLRPQKYEPEPEWWQQVAIAWDRAQTRPRIDKSVQDKNICLEPSKLLPRR